MCKKTYDKIKILKIDKTNKGFEIYKLIDY